MHQHCKSAAWLFPFLLLVASPPLAEGASPRPAQPGKPGELKGLEAQQYLFNHRMYADAERFGYAGIWNDMRMPQELSLLAQTLEALKRNEEAAVYYTLAVRAVGELEQSTPKPDAATAAKYKQVRVLADRKLKLLDKEFAALKAKHEKSAAGRKFESPDKVDEGWMTQVKADLRGLHALYAWKLVGGRKDAKPDWIHNTSGVMHRSGLKYVEETDGRKGVLFATLDKNPEAAGRPEDKDAAPRGSIRLINPGKGKVLRIGTKGYNFPFILKVTASGKELLSQKVGEKEWEDLKIGLGEAGAGGQPVTLQLLVPEGQKWHEGAWFDYIDFFDT